jgi:hypothetical protein
MEKCGITLFSTFFRLEEYFAHTYMYSFLVATFPLCIVLPPNPLPTRKGGLRIDLGRIKKTGLMYIVKGIVSRDCGGLQVSSRSNITRR